jgi:hypothetical protein
MTLRSQGVLKRAVLALGLTLAVGAASGHFIRMEPM